MNTNPQTKGFLTSEFWLALGGVLASILVAMGVITLNQVDPFLKYLADIYSGVAAVIAIWKIVEAYIKGRNAIKQQLLANPPVNQA